MGNSNEEIDQLLLDLKSDAPEKQLRAIKTAGEQKISPAVPSLIEVVQGIIDPYQASVRQVLETAIWALGEIGDPRAIPALISNLENAFYKIQATTMAALGKLGAKEAVEPIWRAARNTSSPQFLQIAAIEALGSIADKAAKDHLQELIEDPQAARYLKEKATQMLHYIQGFW